MYVFSPSQPSLHDIVSEDCDSITPVVKLSIVSVYAEQDSYKSHIQLYTKHKEKECVRRICISSSICTQKSQNSLLSSHASPVTSVMVKELSPR